MSSKSVEMIKTNIGLDFRLNTPREDAEIVAAAMADPDARELSDAEWEAVRGSVRIGRAPYVAPSKRGLEPLRVVQPA
jgi:hypothetical protein